MLPSILKVELAGAHMVAAVVGVAWAAEGAAKLMSLWGLKPKPILETRANICTCI